MLGGKLAPFGLGDDASFGDADQRVVRLVVLAPREERLVCGDDRQVVRVGELEQRGLDLPSVRQPVALQLDVEPVAEDRGELRAARRRKLDLAARDREVERAARPAGQRDQTFVADRQASRASHARARPTACPGTRAR